VKCFDSISTFLDASKNWCGLLALLIEGAHAIIGDVSGAVYPNRKFENVKQFTDRLRETYRDDQQRMFMISFFCNNDLKKDCTVLIILNSLVDETFGVPPPIFDRVVRFVNLVNLTAAGNAQLVGATLAVRLLIGANHLVAPEVLALVRPKLIRVKQKKF
jgi:hypothetical protein